MLNWRKSVVFSLLRLTSHQVARNLAYLHALDASSLAEQRGEQERKLSAVLLHAHRSVPYYRRVLEEAGVVGSCPTVRLEALDQVPYLTKETIRREGARLYSTDHEKRRSYLNTSGGSTGEPVVVLQDAEYWDMNGLALKIFYQQRLGRDVGEPEVDLWGSERDVFRNSLSYKERAINYLYNRTLLNAFKFDEAKLGQFVDVINRKRPISMWVSARN